MGKGNAMKKVLLLVAFSVIAIGCMPGVGAAQQQPPAAANQSPTIKRTPLQKYDVPGAPLETVIGIAEIVPNVVIGRHTHPGMEGGYVLEGELLLMIDGQAPKSLKAGESYQIPLEAIHDAKSGPSGAKVLAVYTVRKGEPLATPAK
jgi:quercetin dioxygenase-like cupin family protein